MDSYVKAVKAYAIEHYEEGWDVVVEAYTDSEIAEEIKGARSPGGAIRKMASYIGLHSEQRANVLSQSGEHEAEAAKASRDAEQANRLAGEA